MSLLTIVQAVCRRVGVPVPSSVVNNTDASIAQMLELAREEGQSLYERYAWQRLVTEATFTTLAAETQVSSIPTTYTDYGYYIPGTMWNRTTRVQVFGPLNDQDWQSLKAITTTAVRPYFRIRGNKILFLPSPAAGESVYFEYVSKNWCESSGGTGQSDWSADTDVARIDEELFKKGVDWRFRKAKGLDYSEEFRQYEVLLAKKAAEDGAKPVLSMRGGMPRLSNGSIPEGSWNQ